MQQSQNIKENTGSTFPKLKVVEVTYKQFLLSVYCPEPQEELPEDEKERVEATILRDDIGTLVISPSLKDPDQYNELWHGKGHDYIQGIRNASVWPELMLKAKLENSGLVLEPGIKNLCFGYTYQEILPDGTKEILPGGLSVYNTYDDTKFFCIALIKNAAAAPKDKKITLIYNEDFELEDLLRKKLFSEHIANLPHKEFSAKEFLASIGSEYIQKFISNLFTIENDQIVKVNCPNFKDLNLQLKENNKRRVEHINQDLEENPNLYHQHQRTEQYDIIDKDPNKKEDIILDDVTKIPNLDLYEYPAPILPLKKGQRCKIGDVNGNPLSILYPLIKYGIIKLSKEDYEKLVEIYKEHLSKTESLKKEKIIVDEKGNKTRIYYLEDNVPTFKEYQDLYDFKSILEKIEFATEESKEPKEIECDLKASDALVFGDERAERGPNDWFIHFIWDVFNKKGKERILLLFSNHGHKFITDYEKKAEEIDYSMSPIFSLERQKQFTKHKDLAFEKIEKICENSMYRSALNKSLNESEIRSSAPLMKRGNLNQTNKNLEELDLGKISKILNAVSQGELDRIVKETYNPMLFGYTIFGDEIEIDTHAPVPIPEIIKQIAQEFKIEYKDEIPWGLAETINKINEHFLEHYVKKNCVSDLNFDDENSPFYRLIWNRFTFKETKLKNISNNHGHVGTSQINFGDNKRNNLDGDLGKGFKHIGTFKVKISSNETLSSQFQLVDDTEPEEKKEGDSKNFELDKNDAVIDDNQVDKNSKESSCDYYVVSVDESAGEPLQVEIKLNEININDLLRKLLINPLSRYEIETENERVTVSLFKLSNDKILAVPSFVTNENYDYDVRIQQFVTEALENDPSNFSGVTYKNVGVLSVAGDRGLNPYKKPNHAVCGIKGFGEENITLVDVRQKLTGFLVDLFKKFVTLGGWLDWYQNEDPKNPQSLLNDTICAYCTLTIVYFIFESLHNDPTILDPAMTINKERFFKPFYAAIEKATDLHNFIQKLGKRKNLIYDEDKEFLLIDFFLMLRKTDPKVYGREISGDKGLNKESNIPQPIEINNQPVNENYNLEKGKSSDLKEKIDTISECLTQSVIFDQKEIDSNRELGESSDLSELTLNSLTSSLESSQKKQVPSENNPLSSEKSVSSTVRLAASDKHDLSDSKQSDQKFQEVFEKPKEYPSETQSKKIPSPSSNQKDVTHRPFSLAGMSMALEKKKQKELIEKKRKELAEKETEAIKSFQEIQKLLENFENGTTGLRINVAQQLHSKLKALSNDFLKKDISGSSYQDLKTACESAIEEAKSQLKNLHRRNNAGSLAIASLVVLALLPLGIPLAIPTILAFHSIIGSKYASMWSKLNKLNEQIQTLHNDIEATINPSQTNIKKLENNTNTMDFDILGEYLSNKQYSKFPNFFVEDSQEPEKSSQESELSQSDSAQAERPINPKGIK